MKLYFRLFSECARNNLKFWECPQALFFLLGILTISIMIGTYLVANVYASPEIVVVSVAAIALIMIIVSHLVSQAVSKINYAKRQAEIERLKTEAIIFNLNDGLVLLNLDCQIILLNPKAEEYLEVKEKDILNFDITKKELKEKYPYLSAVFSWCPVPWHFLKKKIISEGISFGKPKRYFQVYTTPVINSFAKHLGYVKILHEITREKELDQMKSEFISLASHQLCGPLSATKWLCESLLAGREGKINKKQKQFLDEISQSNERMVRLVSELLDVARIEERRMELTKENIAFDKLLAEIIKTAATLALQKKIALILSSPQKLLYAKIDIEKMKMVFQNLVENAIKYTPQGGSVEVKIKEIRGDELKKSIYAMNYQPLTMNHYLLVSVSDTGIGIAPGDKNKIFSKFYRGQRAKEIVAQGTGLGLYIGKQIIEKHGGRIWFESKEGKGTIFYVVIPKN